MGGIFSDVTDDEAAPTAVAAASAADDNNDEKTKPETNTKQQLEDSLRDAADVLRWSASGKDAAEKRAARAAAAAAAQRLAFALALLLPPLAVAAVDGAVGACTTRSQLTHSLKPPGFNP